MEIQEAIKKRRTTHSFNTNQVQEIIIRRALEAANFAPCHLHTFPWRFTSLGRKKRELLVQLSLRLKFEDCSPDPIAKERVIKKILNPSHLLVASQILNTESKRRLEDYAACSCAIQNLCLSLIGDGVGSKWSTGKITTHKNTYKIVEINPEEQEIIGFIWIGYGNVPSKLQRPQISSIFREL